MAEIIDFEQVRAARQIREGKGDQNAMSSTYGRHTYRLRPGRRCWFIESPLPLFFECSEGLWQDTSYCGDMEPWRSSPANLTYLSEAAIGDIVVICTDYACPFHYLGVVTGHARVSAFPDVDGEQRDQVEYFLKKDDADHSSLDTGLVLPMRAVPIEELEDFDKAYAFMDVIKLMLGMHVDWHSWVDPREGPRPMGIPGWYRD